MNHHTTYLCQDHLLTEQRPTEFHYCLPHALMPLKTSEYPYVLDKSPTAYESRTYSPLSFQYDAIRGRSCGIMVQDETQSDLSEQFESSHFSDQSEYGSDYERDVDVEHQL